MTIVKNHNLIGKKIVINDKANDYSPIKYPKTAIVIGCRSNFGSYDFKIKNGRDIYFISEKYLIEP